MEEKQEESVQKVTPPRARDSKLHVQLMRELSEIKGWQNWMKSCNRCFEKKFEFGGKIFKDLLTQNTEFLKWTGSVMNPDSDGMKNLPPKIEEYCSVALDCLNGEVSGENNQETLIEVQGRLFSWKLWRIWMSSAYKLMDDEAKSLAIKMIASDRDFLEWTETELVKISTPKLDSHPSEVLHHSLDYYQKLAYEMENSEGLQEDDRLVVHKFVSDALEDLHIKRENIRKSKERIRQTREILACSEPEEVSTFVSGNCLINRLQRKLLSWPTWRELIDMVSSQLSASMRTRFVDLITYDLNFLEMTEGGLRLLDEEKLDECPGEVMNLNLDYFIKKTSTFNRAPDIPDEDKTCLYQAFNDNLKCLISANSQYSCTSSATKAEASNINTDIAGNTTCPPSRRSDAQTTRYSKIPESEGNECETSGKSDSYYTPSWRTDLQSRTRTATERFPDLSGDSKSFETKFSAPWTTAEHRTQDTESRRPTDPCMESNPCMPHQIERNYNSKFKELFTKPERKVCPQPKCDCAEFSDDEDDCVLDSYVFPMFPRITISVPNHPDVEITNWGDLLVSNWQHKILPFLSQHSAVRSDFTPSEPIQYYVPREEFNLHHSIQYPPVEPGYINGVCGQCNRNFCKFEDTATELRNHVIGEHRGMWRCQFCRECVCGELSDLEDHVRGVHLLVPYRMERAYLFKHHCLLCPARYESKRLLAKHFNSVHAKRCELM